MVGAHDIQTQEQGNPTRVEIDEIIEVATFFIFSIVPATCTVFLEALEPKSCLCLCRSTKTTVRSSFGTTSP